MVDVGFSAVLADGETYELSPISVRDWSAFCRWVNERTGSKPDAPLSFAEMMDAAQTIDGMVWLVHRSVIRRQPRVSRDAVLDLPMDRLGDLAVRVMATPEASDSDPPAKVEEGPT